MSKKGRHAMFPWSGHITFDTQTILTIGFVFAILATLVWVVNQLYPPDPEPPKPKVPDLPPHAPPRPPPIKLGPRFAYIEAWKREQEKDKPFFPDVLVIGATPAADSDPVEAEAEEGASPDAETLEEEAGWLNDRPRPLASRMPMPGMPSMPMPMPVPNAQAQVAEVQPEDEPDTALETMPAADDEAAPRLPSLRPVSPDDLVEFGWLKKRGDAAERPEAAAEVRPSLHPVSLEWSTNDPFEEPAPEPVQPVEEDPPRAEQLPAMTRPKAVTEEAAGEAPALLPTSPAPAAPAEAPPLVIQAFGRAQLLVLGRSLGQHSTQRLELVLYLAHDALQPGGEAAFVDRLLISDALWPGVQAEGTQLLVNLRACKANLLEDVAAAGLSLEQYPWLETGPENALRLHPAVASDLSSFTALVEQIAEVRAQAERGARVVTLAQVETWQAELQALYRGEFAQQFKPKPWITKARRFYQARAAQARFDLARLLVCLGRERQAIEVGTETVLEADPTGSGMMRLLVAWVQRQEPIERQAWASRFAAEYEHRYGQTLAKAHEKMETLRLSVLPGR